MPTVRTILPQSTNEAVPILRVAAYCRVSSDSDDQQHSFGVQTEYYRNLIGENPLWTLADIYADEGITGTSTRRRDEFNRMISDCKKGKIDRILTKSVSRFARNTVDCLETVRMLSGLGISILFEKEQIDTAKMSSEVILSFMSTQAQDESASISGNMLWSYEKRMKNGSFICCYTPYGYRWQDRDLIIVEEEAEIVRRIYSEYLSGVGMVQIARGLDADQVPHRNGYHWTPETIDYILHNEKYTGDALLQKFFTTTTLPVKQKENRGQKRMFYVENSHPSIISKDTYLAAQALTAARRPKPGTPQRHPFVGLIHCGQCGHPFRRVVRGNTVYWKCRRYVKQKTDCVPIRIDEEDVIAAVIRAGRVLKENPQIIAETVEALSGLYEKSNASPARLSEIDQKITTLVSQIHLLSQLQTQGILDAADFTGQRESLNSQVAKLRAERSAILRRDDESDIAELRELADAIEDLDTEDAESVMSDMLQLMEQITVISNTEITITLTGGLTIPERLPKKKRR